MQESIDQINQLWEVTSNERISYILDDDIKAATKHLGALNNEKEELLKQLSDLEFNLEELQLENDSLKQNSSESNSSQAGTFFVYLSYLENEENSLKAELKAHQQMSRELSHKKNIIFQKNRSLHHKIEIERQQIEDETEQIAIITDNLQERNDILYEKQQYFSELQAACTQFEAEINQKNEEIKSYGKTVTENLIQQEAQLKAKIEKKQKKYEEMKKEVAKEERKMQKAINLQKEQLMIQQSSRNWQNERALLMGKLQKLRTQLLTQAKNSENSKNRNNELRKRLKSILDDDDPGDGTGMRAKKLVFAEIKSIENRQPSHVDEELMLEQGYSEELSQQLDLIRESVRLFKLHREETFKSLKEELDECTQGGYLRLLQEEFNELQISLTKI